MKEKNPLIILSAIIFAIFCFSLPLELAIPALNRHHQPHWCKIPQLLYQQATRFTTMIQPMLWLMPSWWIPSIITSGTEGDDWGPELPAPREVKSRKIAKIIADRMIRGFFSFIQKITLLCILNFHLKTC